VSVGTSNAPQPTRRPRIDGGRAVLAARDADTEPNTTELTRLAAVAGYDPVASVTQHRREESGTWLSRGKAAALTDRAAETDADAVLIDGDLTFGQYANLLELLPRGTELVDRYRLVLGIFADGSADRAGHLPPAERARDGVAPRVGPRA
jgi:GTP-binding protein HflX